MSTEHTKVPKASAFYNAHDIMSKITYCASGVYTYFGFARAGRRKEILVQDSHDVTARRSQLILDLLTVRAEGAFF